MRLCQLPLLNLIMQGKNAFCTNLWKCDDCTNRLGGSQSVLTMRVGTSSDDEYHDAIDNDELDIYNQMDNQNDNCLELIYLLSDEEDDRGDVEEDVIDFLSI